MHSLSQFLSGSSLPSAGPDLLIGLDIDGTILHHDTSLSERVGAALSAHLSAGTRLVLATGRGIYGTQVALEQVGLSDGFAICSNGAIVLGIGAYDSPRPIHSEHTEFLAQRPERTLEVGYPFHILDFTTFDPRREVMQLHAALPQALLAVEELDGPRRVTHEFPPGELTGPNTVLPVSQIGVEHATRLTVRVPEMSSSQLMDIVESLGLNGVEYSVGWSAWLDVSPDGISKASALENVRQACEISPEATLAVGDGGNDITMLEWAQVGIAMGSANDRVKKSADAVADPVEADGLATVLEALL